MRPNLRNITRYYMLKLATFHSFFFLTFILPLSYRRILSLSESAIFLGEPLSTSRTKGKHNSSNLRYSYDPLGTSIKKKQPAFSLLPHRSSLVVSTTTIIVLIVRNGP